MLKPRKPVAPDLPRNKSNLWIKLTFYNFLSSIILSCPPYSIIVLFFYKTIFVWFFFKILWSQRQQHRTVDSNQSRLNHIAKWGKGVKGHASKQICTGRTRLFFYWRDSSIQMLFIAKVTNENIQNYWESYHFTWQWVERV